MSEQSAPSAEAQESVAGRSVTVVVVPRERFGDTQAALESIYRNADYPFELVYVDGNSPARVAEYLRKTSAERNFRLLRTEHFLSPNQARNLGLVGVRSDYVVSIDNDFVVEAGWLRHLVECATDTGAWAVAPIIFQGAPKDQVIHTAGGRSHITERDGVRTLTFEQRFARRRYDDVSAELIRSESEMFEFHCVLLSMEAMRAVGTLDEEYLSVCEHDDLGLLIQRAGGTIYLEPAARGTFPTGVLDKSDREYARLRWSDGRNRQSTQHFREKWDLDERWGAEILDWCAGHRRRLLGQRRNPAIVLRWGFRRVAKGLLGKRTYEKLRYSPRRHVS